MDERVEKAVAAGLANWKHGGRVAGAGGGEVSYPVRICFFTVGIEDMPAKKQRNPYDVARVLARHGRFSAFEAADNQTIAATMDWLYASGWFDFDTESCGYPWTKAALTDAGRTALGWLRAGSTCA